MKSRVHAITDIGLVRIRNEDSFFFDKNRGVFAVADGLGGLPGGDLASQTAMRTLERVINDPEIARDPAVWSDALNHAVREAGRNGGFQQTIATTLTMVETCAGRLLLTHLGDSAAFLIREGHIDKLSVNHNVETETLSKGLPVEYLGRYRFALTRYLGMDGPLHPQIKTFDLMKNDRILLATDGLTDLVEPHDILRESAAAEDPESLLEKLVAQCHEKGAHDNITAIALFIREI